MGIYRVFWDTVGVHGHFFYTHNLPYLIDFVGVPGRTSNLRPTV